MPHLMDPAQFESLVARLIQDPHDKEALDQAHLAGQHDPTAYASLLERVAAGTVDPYFSAHWYSEAANVWQALGEPAQAARLFAAGVDRDPSNVPAVQHVAQLHRDSGDVRALAGVLERMSQAVRPLLPEQPDLMLPLRNAHEELASLYGSDALPDAEGSLRHWAALVELEPSNAYAIYQAREQHKARGDFAKALPYFAAEKSIVDDPARREALCRDELEVSRAAGDSVATARVLRELMALRPDEQMLGYELACAVVEGIEARAAVPAADRAEAARVMLQYAESYDGENGLAYATSALKAAPGDDRALQLADYYAEALGRQAELLARYRAYLSENPAGYMAQKARDMVAALGGGEPTGSAAEPSRDSMGAPSHSGPAAAASGGDASPSDEAPVDVASADVASLDGGPLDGQSVGVGPAHPGVAAAVPADAGQPLATDPAVQEAQPEPPPPPPAPSLPPNAIEDARRAAEAKQTLKALELYRRVLAVMPAQPEALSFVEETLRLQRRFEELCDVLTAAARDASQPLDARKSELADVAGICESKLKNFDRAIETWKLVLQLDRGDKAARDRLLALLEKQKRWDELAPMLEQQAMNADEVGEKVALERRLADLHEKERQDAVSAADAWMRVVALVPGDFEALDRAVTLFDALGQHDAAHQAVERALPTASDGDRVRLLVRSADLKVRLGELTGAADRYVEAAELGADEEARTKALELFRQLGRHGDVARALEKRATSVEGKARAEVLAEAAEAHRLAGDPATALLDLQEAALIDADDERYSGAVMATLEAEGRAADLITFVLALADKIGDRAKRAEARHRAVAYQLGAGDETAARATLEHILAEGDDLAALQILFQLAERSQDFADAAARGAQIVELTEGADRLAYAVRVAQLLADNVGDLGAASDMYRRVLAEFDPTNAYAMHSLAELEERRGHHAAAAESFDKLFSALDGVEGMGERRAEIARKLVAMNEGPLASPEGAARWLEILHALDEEDFDVVAKLARAYQALEDWQKAAGFLAKLVEVEGDEEEASRLTLELATLLHEKLGRADDALAALEKLGDLGDRACRDALTDLGLKLERKAFVATKLRLWNESTQAPERGPALRRAFELYLEDGRTAEARHVALELVRSRQADEEVVQRLQDLAIQLRDRDALAAVHDLAAKSLAGAQRAETLVRQAQQLVEVGVDPMEALQHGEMALNSVEPHEATPLLDRLATLLADPAQVIDLYERQVLRCKKPQDRVDALARAAMAAAERGAVERAREFLANALGGGVQESTIASIEQAARDADAARGGEPVVLRLFIESLAGGGQGSRDGGRTRAALLRRAAELARSDLRDLDAAFGWLAESIIVHVEDATLEQLESLSNDVGEPRRFESALNRALEEVVDGPVVRRLLRKRADLRASVLGDKHRASEDLKRLHDLSPSDQDLTKELADLLTELGNHRGMIELYEDQILRGRQPHVRAELARKVAILWEEAIGDAREAADAWRRVLRMKAGDKEAMAGLERCKNGKLQRATAGAPAAARGFEPTPAPPSVSYAAPAPAAEPASLPNAPSAWPEPQQPVPAWPTTPTDVAAPGHWQEATAAVTPAAATNPWPEPEAVHEAFSPAAAVPAHAWDAGPPANEHAAPVAAAQGAEQAPWTEYAPSAYGAPPAPPPPPPPSSGPADHGAFGAPPAPLAEAAPYGAPPLAYGAPSQVFAPPSMQAQGMTPAPASVRSSGYGPPPPPPPPSSPSPYGAPPPPPPSSSPHGAPSPYGGASQAFAPPPPPSPYGGASQVFAPPVPPPPPPSGPAPGPYGAPAGSPYGAPPPPPSPYGGASQVFAPPAPPSPYGAPAGSPYGAPPPPPPPSGPAPGPYGAPPAPPSPYGGGSQVFAPPTPYGAPPAPPSPYGAPPAPPSPYGAPPAPPSPYGAPPASTAYPMPGSYDPAAYGHAPAAGFGQGGPAPYAPPGEARPPAQSGELLDLDADGLEILDDDSQGSPQK